MIHCARQTQRDCPDYDRAESHVKLALQGFKRLLSVSSRSKPHHLYISEVHQDLATIYREKGEFEAAHEHLSIASEGLRRLCTRGSKMLLDVEWQRVLLEERRHYTEKSRRSALQARREFEKAMNEQTELLGRDHHMTLRTIWRYGSHLMDRGHAAWPAAEELLFEAVTAYSEIDSKDLLEKHSAFAAFGALCAAQGKRSAALEYLKQSESYFETRHDKYSKRQQREIASHIAHVLATYGPTMEGRAAFQKVLRISTDEETRDWAARILEEFELNQSDLLAHEQRLRCEQRV